MTSKPKPLKGDLRERKMVVDRELAELVKQAQMWWTEWVKPHVNDARMITPGGKGPGKTKPLTLKEADMLDVTTPTGRFERGRAHMAALDSRITALRDERTRLVTAIDLMDSDQKRRLYTTSAGRIEMRVLKEIADLA